nr:GNAT family N-acetyltransferase [Ruegeria lacuscaerulensis]
MQANPELVTSGSYYVAEKDGAIIGCGGWTCTAPGTGATTEGLVHARHFAVDPICAQTGVGRAIFERCVMDALATGATRIQALSSLNAEPFYERMGLRRFDLIEVPFGSDAGFPVVLMEGPLKVRETRA